MTIELWLLIYVSGLALVLGFACGSAKFAANGAKSAYQRLHVPPLEGWAARAERAQFNLYESLPLFGALVLIIHVTQSGNSNTEMAAMIFAGARTIHPLGYIFNLFAIRSLAFGVGLAGLIWMGLQLA